MIAAVVVVIGGWFLGQGLARVFNGPAQTKTAQSSPLPIVTPVSSPSPIATAAPVTPSPEPTKAPTARPVRTPAPTATPAPTPLVTATPVPTLAPTAPPAVAATVAPTIAPVVAVTASPATRTRAIQPIARAVPPSSEPGATQTVRSYIDALRRGDPQSAALYLGNGSPDEDFIDQNMRISSITATPNGDGSYKVEVDMQTSKGEYFETFNVASTANGNRILDRTAIQPRKP